MNLRSIALTAFGLIASGAASAATTGYCNTYLAAAGPVMSGWGIAVTDMTYTGKTPSTSADNCYGVDGGNDGTDIGTLWGSTWTLLAKSDGPDGSALNGISFDVSNSATLGTWTLTGTGVPLPQYFDFVGVLKHASGNSGGGFAAYLFDDVVFDGSDGGNYIVSFGPGNNDSTPFDLSHISIYGRSGTPPTDPCETDPNAPGCGGGGGAVPEPASLALVGLGLLGAALARRRQRL